MLDSVAGGACRWFKALVLGTLVLTGCGQQAVFAQGSSKSDNAGEWASFLGPKRNGLSTETGLLKAWPEGGPKVLWRVPGGVGMSGISISRGVAVTLVQREGQQWLVALDAATGQQKWQQKLAPAYQNPMGNGPRATPAISGDSVFAFTGEGILAAFDFGNGKPLWSRRVVKDLGGKEAEYGVASSPLVVGDRVVVTAGAAKGTVVAFDLKTGERAWAVGNDPAGYSSPTLLTLGGREQLVSYTGAAAVGIDPAKGSLLWRYPFETNYECNIAVPLSIDGKLFLSAGENHGSVLLTVKSQGDKVTLDEVWSSFGPKSVLRNEWQTSLLLGGYLYGMDNVGGAGPITNLTCINAATGERAWQEPRFGKGNLIAAEGKLWMSTMKGELILAEASSQRYIELGRVQLLGSTRQAPSLAKGLLYLRDDKEIVCVDVRQSSKP